MNTDSRTEADHLVAAALAAEAEGDAERSTQLLRQSLALSQDNPFAHYLLGTDFAQRGQNGDAILHLTTAVEQAPGLHEARLQLGLLWLTMGNRATAEATLRPLAELPETSALGRFASAISLLAADRVAQACTALQEGLAAGCDNAPLMADMRTLLQRLAAAGLSPMNDAELQSMQLGMAISAYSGSEPDER